MFALIAQGNSLNIGASAPTISPVGTVGKLIEMGAGAILVVGGLAVLLYLLLGGLNWITAGGDKSKIESARSMITQAIIGLAILASVFAVFGLLLNFFGIRDRISLVGGGTTQTGPGGTNPGGTNPGGTNPICTQDQRADDGGAGGYCFVNGAPSSARVICTTTPQIPYLHWSPLCCVNPNATSPAGYQTCP